MSLIPSGKNLGIVQVQIQTLRGYGAKLPTRPCAVVSTYAKWMNDGETSSRRHGVGRPHVIKVKGRRRLSSMAEQKRSQTVAQLTAQYNAGPSRILSEHTV
ncbi:transposable element Tcb1 transposase [Trichonephila clavipes]|nr:transposable element Tcb1 transposase [Trichonephila clavipes]